MNRQERSGITTTLLQAVVEAAKSDINTAIPCIVVSYDAAKQTCVLQPAIQYKFTQKDGSFIWLDLPNLLDCPVFFPSGGGFTLTFPVAAGDEALAIFSQRCIDAWYSSGEHQNIQSDIRLHDLSDGFAFVGIRSTPRFLGGVSTSSAQLRSDDGGTLIDVNNGNIALTASTSVTINSPATHVTGTLAVDGLLTYNDGIAGNPGIHDSIINGNFTQSGGVLSSNGIALDTHVHSGVEPGSGDSGPPA
jgi:hypothetical protein